MTSKSDCEETPSDNSNGEDNPSWQLDGSGISNNECDSSPWSHQSPLSGTDSSSHRPVIVPTGWGRPSAQIISASGWDAMDGTSGESINATSGVTYSASKVPEPVDIAALSGGKTEAVSAVKAKTSKSGVKQRGVFEKKKRNTKEEEKKKPPKTKE